MVLLGTVALVALAFGAYAASHSHTVADDVTTLNKDIADLRKEAASLTKQIENAINGSK